MTLCPRPMCPRTNDLGRSVPWSMHRLDIASVGRCVPDRFILTLGRHTQWVIPTAIHRDTLRATRKSTSFVYLTRQMNRIKMPVLRPLQSRLNLSPKKRQETPGRGWIVRDASSEGHKVDGTLHPWDASSMGCFVHGTLRPRDESFKDFRLGTSCTV
jgi:hypothetical protein